MNKKLFLLVILFILGGVFVFLVIHQDNIEHKVAKLIPENNSTENLSNNSYTIKAGLSNPSGGVSLSLGLRCSCVLQA